MLHFTFDKLGTIETRHYDLNSKEAATDATFASLVEAQQAVISTVTTLTEKLDVIASLNEQMNRASATPTSHSSGMQGENARPPLPPYPGTANRRVKHNVYFALERIYLAALPPPTLGGMICMTSILSILTSATYHQSQTGMARVSSNTSDTTDFLARIQMEPLSSMDVASCVRSYSIPVFFSDHVALSLRYSLPATPSFSYTCNRINILSKYCPTYVSYMTSVFPTLSTESSDALYSSLVSLTHNFSTRNISRSHIAFRS